MFTRFFSILIFLVLTSSASALEIVPFYTRNQSPLVQIFGLPAAEEGALTPDGGTDVRLALDIANIWTGDRNERENLSLDGELYRLVLAVRHGISDRFEIGLDIPYVWHVGGNFDHFINGFHRTFDMPEGNREVTETDSLHYISVRDGETEIYLDDDASGVGDVLVSAGWQLYRSHDARRALALRAGVELPTGKAEKLTGSESTDLSLRLALTDAASLSRGDLTWYASAGALWMSRGDVLPDRQRDVVAFGTAGFGWAPFSWGALKFQLDGHTPFYKNSDLVQLDSSSVQLIAGTSFRLPGQVLFDFGVTEDLVVNTSPDAVFHFALRRRF